MTVATKAQNLYAEAPFRGSLLLRTRPLEIVAAHHYALIPTAWGMCGVMWEQREREPLEGGGPFTEKPDRPLLCKIIPPGLPVQNLRRQLMTSCPLCNEVIGFRHGNFPP